MSLDNILSFREFIRKYPSFKEGTMRMLIFNKKTNGFDSAIIKRGKSVFIDVSEFERIILSQGDKESNG